MKYQIMIGILFTLLARRKISAGELAAKYDCSVRSIYRYIEELVVAGVPVDVARGANGGIYISDTFKLPKGFMTREEYARTREAMLAMLGQTGDEALKSAVEKITTGRSRAISSWTAGLGETSGSFRKSSRSWNGRRRSARRWRSTMLPVRGNTPNG